MGYGNKYDFVKVAAKNPAPNRYEKKSFVKLNKEKRKGKTFGVSRAVY